MNSNSFVSENEIRVQFTRAMSDMYRLEVPLYKKLLGLANNVNNQAKSHIPELTTTESRLLKLEHHGAIRLGSPAELAMIRRLFQVMGMLPVDYYDLSVADIPVHSTAFRALDIADIEVSPFRVFCSLLRLDLIENQQLRKQATEILNKRQIFPEELLKLIDLSEKQGGLNSEQANSFIENALEVFRWHQNSTVNKDVYDDLKDSHGLIADIVSFKGPHINHLTPKILDIDACQAQFAQNDINAKAVVEGPPKRNCPILLRQTSFIAIAEDIIFTDGETGTHTARFGEVEQRGIALTPKGRELYDQLLLKAKNGNTEIEYSERLNEVFKEFPDTYTEIRQQELGYFYYTPTSSEYTSDKSLKNYSNNQINDIDVLIIEGFIKISPIVYEDFLPVSAAGIFTSNLASENNKNNKSMKRPTQKINANLQQFETALGTKITDSFGLYEAAQKASLNNALKTLGYKL